MGPNGGDTTWKQNYDQVFDWSRRAHATRFWADVCIFLTALCVDVWGGWWAATIADFISYLDGLQRFSVIDARSCEKPVTATEIWEIMSNCTSCKLPDLDGLPYEFYVFILDLFGSLLSDVYSNWQQNGRTPNALIRDEGNTGEKRRWQKEITREFSALTLLNTKFKIFIQVLAKRLALVWLGRHNRAQSRAGLSTKTSILCEIS